ncbi:hypothetical protein OC842_002289 [Tilletia horrida]|uniref:Polyketide synthase phosphopantetheine-binding domain-containing protein n=1 Tax=Tilletia horrida TaxID=155126 RepID=A0AAN6GEU8_9BASI|nr:hypothetical protein OC842_002289 [Tilletia horrida]
MTSLSGPILIPQIFTQTAAQHPDAVISRHAKFNWNEVDSCDQPSAWLTTTCADWEALLDAGAFLFGEKKWPLRTRKEQDSEPVKVAALLENDLSGSVAMFSLIKRGNAVLLLSPRNAINLLVDMMAHEGIQHITYSPSFASLAKAAADGLAQRSGGKPPTVTVVPSLEELNTARTHYGKFPYDLDVQKEWKRPIFYVHTSGSSGSMPTICPYTHEISVETERMCRSIAYGATAFLTLSPIYHVMGLVRTFMYSALNLSTITVGPQGPPPSGRHVSTLLYKSGCDTITLVPSIIQTIAETEDGLDALKRLKCLMYGGAGLSNQAKQALDKAGVFYVGGFGMSECSMCGAAQPNLWPDGKALDREWMLTMQNFHETTFELFSDAGDGLPALYELIIRPGRVPLSIANRGDSHATGDLVMLHPEHPEWFRVWGRKSEMVILLNGENAPVKPLEQAVGALPLVAAALLFGHARPQVGLLVELTAEAAIDPDDEAAVERVRNELWPTIKKTNAELPNFAQLFKNMIMFTDPRKPLPRTDKGTIKRQLSLKLYDAEIDAVYGAAASGQGTTAKIRSISLDSLQDLIIEILHSLYGQDATIKPNTSLTLELGQDSLRATFLRSALVSAFREAIGSGQVPELKSFKPDSVSPHIAYDHSSPKALAEALLSLIQNGEEVDHDASQVKLMQEMISKYSQRLDAAAKAHTNGVANGAAKKKNVVLLTGSTGAFGVCLLEQLVDHPGVDSVICLVRSSDDAESALKKRQVDAFVSKKLDPAPANSSKVRYLHGNPTDANLQVPGEVTAIIHAAWSVNFQLSLSDYTPEIEGVVRFLEHCLRTHARLVFASSVATTGSNKTGAVDGIKEEDDIPLEWAMFGYGRSKSVSEKIITHAVHNCGVEAVSVRCGQIIGDERSGAWNTTEWAPSIFRSAPALNVLPAEMGVVDWITVNDSMQVLVAAALEPKVRSATPASTTNVVHLLNPNKTSWTATLDAFRSHLPKSVRVVPTHEWFQHLKAAQAEAEASGTLEEASERIPSLRLLSRMFNADDESKEGRTAGLVVKEAIALTGGRLSSARTIDEDLAGRYLRFWLS